MNNAEEEDNCMRLYILINRFGTKVVRDLFNRIFPANSLTSTLKSYEQDLKELYLKRRLNEVQFRQLFPSTGTSVNSMQDLFLLTAG